MKTPDKPGNGLISHLVLSTYKHKCALIFFLKTPTKGVFNTLCNPFTHGGRCVTLGQADGRNYMCRKKLVTLFILD